METAAETRVRALPPLGPRAFLAFRILWTAALVLALAAVAAGNYRDIVRSNERPFGSLGLGWTVVGGEIRLRDPSGSEARAAGIREGHAIIAIDGVPVGTSIESAGEIERRLKGPLGTRVRLVTRAPDGTIAGHRLTRSRRNIEDQYIGTGLTPGFDRWLRLLAGVIPSLALIGAAALLLRGRRNEPVPALLSLAFLVQAGSNFAAWNFYDTVPLLVFRHVLSSVAATGIILGLLAFPHGRFEPRWTAWAAAATLAWGVVFSLLQPAQWPDLVWAVLLVAAIFGLWQRSRGLADGRERPQIRWVLLGFAWGTAMLLVSSALYILAAADGLARPASIWSVIAADWLGSLGFCAMAAGLLVALLRYRLYDVDALISRSAGYALLTVGFVAVFAASEKLLEIVGERYFSGAAGSFSGGIAAALAAVVVAPLHNRLQSWAERRFHKALDHLRRDLPARLDHMRETEPLGDILGEALSQIAPALHASRAAAVVGGRIEAVRDVREEEVAQWLSRVPLDRLAQGCAADRADPLFPLRQPLSVADAGGPPVGWLLLGPRPDGSFFTRDEEEALVAVGDPIARAVRIAELRRAREDALRDEFDRRSRTLEAKVTALGATGAPVRPADGGMA